MLNFAALSIDELYMSRCLLLAGTGAGNVAPNPMVGAVLVYEERIIGEGYHQQFGGPHAEVNCINSVAGDYQHLVADSTLYVSLEPCSHFGKTPPCADLIISRKIKKVVIGTRDPFAKVDGSGIQKLRDAGIEVSEGVLEKECISLNKHFFYFHTHHRPFVTLKWAESADGFIAAPGYKAVAISNSISNRWVHWLRAGHSAIMVGFNTARYDDPSLTTRLWPGENPLRIVIDKQLHLSRGSKLLIDGIPTLVLNFIKQGRVGAVEYYQLDKDRPLLKQLMDILYAKNIISLLVEGGSRLLQSFIDEGYWNEACKITSPSTLLGDGIAGPLINHTVAKTSGLGDDQISFYKKD